MVGLPLAPAPTSRRALPAGRSSRAVTGERRRLLGAHEAGQLRSCVREIGAGRSVWFGTGVFRPSNPVIASRISYSPSPPQRVVAQSASVQRPCATVARRAGKWNPPRRLDEHGLSDREGDVMDPTASGMTNSPIAAVCSVSCLVDGKSVKNHCDRNFTALHASRHSEAVALRLGTAHATEGGTRHHA